jgi:type IV secretory pathway VirB9-like protein
MAFAIYNISKYLKGKRRIMKTQTFQNGKNITFQKSSKIKKPKSFQDIIIIT